MRSTLLARTLAVATSGAALVALSVTPALAAPSVSGPAAAGAVAGVAAAPAPTGGAPTDPGPGMAAGGVAAGAGAAVGSGVAAGGPAPASSNCPQTAAQTLNWGQPTRQSDFSGTALPPDWHAYGPEPGHDKQGTRSPKQITVADGVATLTGDEQGNTAAMSWHPGQRYGRWEVCVKSDPGPGGYNSVILLWPVKEDWPVGGEIDWMEISADDRQSTDFFLHYGADNSQESGTVQHDATQWTAYALEWTPQRMTAYVNGKQWYSTTETSHFPPGAMNMTVQLDLFPPATGHTSTHVDWAKQWALPESEPAQLSLAPGAPATGQPDLHPDRTPKPLSQLPPAASTGAASAGASGPGAVGPGAAGSGAAGPGAAGPGATGSGAARTGAAGAGPAGAVGAPTGAAPTGGVGAGAGGTGAGGMGGGSGVGTGAGSGVGAGAGSGATGGSSAGSGG